MAFAPLSASFQSIPPLPTSKLGPSGAASRVGGLVHVLGTLWISPANSPVRLGVSPAAASTPTGVFNQWFEALFPHTGTLGFEVRHLVHQLLLHCQLQPGLPCSTIRHLTGSASCPLAASPLHPVAHLLSSPSGLDECFFFFSLVVGLPYSSIFCQFWLFFFFLIVVVLLLVVQGGTVCLPMPPSQLEV